MSKLRQEITLLTDTIDDSIESLVETLYYELARPDKAFEIEHDGEHYNFCNALTEKEKYDQHALRNKLIHKLIRDALLFGDWSTIIGLVSGEDPADHQFEIIKEEIVYNLDAEGNPISAKPLNEDSVYVQWQDQNKFNFEESK